MGQNGMLGMEKNERAGEEESCVYKYEFEVRVLRRVGVLCSSCGIAVVGFG